MVLAHPAPRLGFLVQSKSQVRPKRYRLSYSTPDIQIFRSKINRSSPTVSPRGERGDETVDASPGGGDMSRLHCSVLRYTLRLCRVIHTSASTWLQLRPSALKALPPLSRNISPAARQDLATATKRGTLPPTVPTG